MEDLVYNEYLDKKIMITGSTGFVGKNLMEIMNKSGYSFLYPVSSSDCDLTNISDVKGLFDEMKPEVVIHLAAKCGGIGANMASPAEFFYDNMRMGMNIIETSRLMNVQKIVFTSTICAYPKFTEVPFKERHLWDGYPEETNAPYAVAKKSLGVMLSAYYQQYGLRSTLVMPTNLYGPHDNFDLVTSHVIPAIIKKVLYAKETSAKSIELWGDGSPSRDFLYVDDACRGILDAMTLCSHPIPINLGSGREVTIRELANIICSIVDYKGILEWEKEKPNGQPRRCLDTSRASCLLDWEPHQSLENGLKETIEWYNGKVNNGV